MGRHAWRWLRVLPPVLFVSCEPEPGLPDWFCVRCAGELGNENPDSYIYQKRGSFGYSIPFTQVFLRPKLTPSVTLNSQIGSGSAASNRRALPNSYTMPVRWRTSEQTGTGKKNEMNTYVQATFSGRRHRLHRWRLRACGVGWRRAR